MKGLTATLQSKLNELNSSVRLLTSQETAVKMNFDDWAFGEANCKSFQVCNILKTEQKQLQLLDKNIIAGQITTTDLKTIALIIEGWLSNNQTVGQLKERYNDLTITEKYSNLLTLNVDELLEKRWTDEYERILKRQTLFNPELFLALKKKLYNLFPFFSHDNLWFSNILELPNDKFKSPIIFCNKDIFEVGLTLDNSQSNNSFKTTNISLAVDRTIQLLPEDFEMTRNPLRP